MKPELAKYSASSRVETVIGPTSFPRATFATSMLLGVLTCGLNIVLNSSHFFLALLQFFSKSFLSKIKQGVFSSFKLFIFIFNLILLKIFDFSTNQENNFLGPVDSQIKTEGILPKNVKNFNEEKFNLDNYFDDFVSIFINVCNEFSITKEEVLNFLTSQSSVEHRFEHFHTKNGVKFINDSKSTNLESVNKATYKVKNCLLIMHGLLKGIDIKRLSLSNEIKEIMVPNNSEFDINSNNFLVIEYENFEDLKKYIKNNYKKFDTVLFSCGGSSFSNFKNYMERGEYFKEMIVGEIS